MRLIVTILFFEISFLQLFAQQRINEFLFEPITDCNELFGLPKLFSDECGTNTLGAIVFSTTIKGIDFQLRNYPREYIKKITYDN